MAPGIGEATACRAGVYGSNTLTKRGLQSTVVTRWYTHYHRARIRYDLTAAAAATVRSFSSFQKVFNNKHILGKYVSFVVADHLNHLSVFRSHLLKDTYRGRRISEQSFQM